ncbi:MAG TPA: VWA domain-containing protein, partial [Edaphobacter sp.]
MTSLGQTPPATGTAVPTIKTGIQTVLVDVVVGDSSGKSVPGLKLGDFAIYEDGKPQAITYFEAHGGASTTVGKTPKLPEGMYSNFPAEVKSDVVDVVLLDSLNTPTEDQMMVRREMIAYLKAIPPGTRIAIFTLSSHLRMVNGFTTDPTVLLNTLNRKGG